MVHSQSIDFLQMMKSHPNCIRVNFIVFPKPTKRYLLCVHLQCIWTQRDWKHSAYCRGGFQFTRILRIYYLYIFRFLWFQQNELVENIKIPIPSLCNESSEKKQQVCYWKHLRHYWNCEETNCWGEREQKSVRFACLNTIKWREILADGIFKPTISGKN